jgi:hypothetical protein
LPAITLVIVASLLACDPSPNYPPAAEPLVGKILEEKDVHTTGAALELGLFYDPFLGGDHVRVVVPAAAYPAGTRVTLRGLISPQMRTTTVVVLSKFLSGGPDYYPAGDALQVLSENQAPSVPLHIELAGRYRPWAYDLLYAREDAQAWSIIGNLQVAGSTLSFDVTEPGLWTVGQLPLPPSLQGRLISPDLRLLDLVGTTYSLAIPTVPGCYEVETGTMTAIDASGTIYEYVDFFSSSRAWARLMYSLDSSGTGINFVAQDSDSCDPVGCAKAPVGHFVVSQSGTPDPLPAPPDGGCPAAAGGAGDAGPN